jgi:hypothetical protein
MNDGSDQLLAKRFAALSSPLDDSDWLDVRRRAGLRRTHVWVALPVAAALAAILVGSALALYRDSIDFWSTAPAPERIVVDFHKMRTLGSALGSVGLGNDVIPGEARRITTFAIDGEPRGLFVAPTGEGGYCWRLHFVSSCGRTGQDRPALSAGWLESDHGGASWINGDFLDPEIARIELEYEDGTLAPVPFVWVTAPIDAGFFSFDVPPEHLPAGHRATAIRAFDEDGDELARQKLPFSDPRWENGPDGLPRAADRTQKRTLFDLRDHKGNPWTIVVAPAPGDRLCFAYNFGSGCFTPKFPRTNDQLHLNGGGVVSVCCAVGDGVATVELRYQDGTRTELTPVEGFLLYLIPPEHYRLGHRLERIAWLDAEGRKIASRAVQPDRRAVYPCSKEEEIDLGHGVRMCP